jgi:hypothetical protein
MYKCRWADCSDGMEGHHLSVNWLIIANEECSISSWKGDQVACVPALFPQWGMWVINCDVMMVIFHSIDRRYKTTRNCLPAFLWVLQLHHCMQRTT